MNQKEINRRTRGERPKVAKLTRSNVAYDLSISPHMLEVPYDHGETLVYVFSSKLYKDKFYNALFENREKINESLSNRFGFRISSDLLCDLKLYISIEKRGFLILKDKEKMVCQEDIILDGNRVMTKR